MPNRQSAESPARSVRRVLLLKPPQPIVLSGLSRPVVSARTVVIVRCFQRTNADSVFVSPIGVHGESRTLTVDNVSLAPLQPLRFMSVNIQDIVRHMAELQIRLQEHKPHILVVQETWLDESTPRVTIGFLHLSRLDRARAAQKQVMVELHFLHQTQILFRICKIQLRQSVRGTRCTPTLDKFCSGICIVRRTQVSSRSQVWQLSLKDSGTSLLAQ